MWLNLRPLFCPRALLLPRWEPPSAPRAALVSRSSVATSSDAGAARLSDGPAPSAASSSTAAEEAAVDDDGWARGRTYLRAWSEEAEGSSARQLGCQGARRASRQAERGTHSCLMWAKPCLLVSVAAMTGYGWRVGRAEWRFEAGSGAAPSSLVPRSRSAQAPRPNCVGRQCRPASDVHFVYAGPLSAPSRLPSTLMRARV